MVVSDGLWVVISTLFTPTWLWGDMCVSSLGFYMLEPSSLPSPFVFLFPVCVCLSVWRRRGRGRRRGGGRRRGEEVSCHVMGSSMKRSMWTEASWQLACEWRRKWILQPQAARGRDGSPRQQLDYSPMRDLMRSWATPGFPESQKLRVIINGYCFRLLSLGIICYIAINIQYMVPSS